MSITEQAHHFAPRGLGSNWLPCFICDVERAARMGTEGGVIHWPLKTDMAAFVADKEEGEAVVALFAAHGLVAKLDYRDFEPNWVQVKVGACDKHVINLKLLQALVMCNSRVIVPSILDEVKS